MPISGVEPLPDGGAVIVCGSSQSNGVESRTGIVVVKLSANYQVVWAKFCELDSDYYFHQLALCDSGDVYVAAVTDIFSNESEGEYLFVALLDQSGEEKWAKRFSRYDWPPQLYGLAVNSFNEALILETNTIIKLDSSAQVIWEKKIAYRPGDPKAYSIVTISNGDVLIGGDWLGKGALVAAWDATGLPKFARAWYSQSERGTECIRALAVADNGATYAVGGTDRAYGVWHDVDLWTSNVQHTISDWDCAWIDINIAVQESAVRIKPLVGKLDMDVPQYPYSGNHQVVAAQLDTN
jgi:hypothetical protein